MTVSARDKVMYIFVATLGIAFLGGQIIQSSGYYTISMVWFFAWMILGMFGPIVLYREGAREFFAPPGRRAGDG